MQQLSCNELLPEAVIVIVIVIVIIIVIVIVSRSRKELHLRSKSVWQLSRNELQQAEKSDRRQSELIWAPTAD